MIGPSYEVRNVSKSLYWFLPEFRRVAVLPLTCETDRSQAEYGRDLLWPVLLDEVRRSQRFEVVVVSSEALLTWTGKSEWEATEPLPPGLLTSLRDETGADAVLFSHLTRFHAYPPMIQGFSLKLINLNPTQDDPEVVWAVDEVFDASDPTVVNAARRFERDRAQGARSLSDSRFILNSPTRFGHYVLDAIFSTLPER